jgi:hypothetical protein
MSEYRRQFNAMSRRRGEPSDHLLRHWGPAHQHRLGAGGPVPPPQERHPEQRAPPGIIGPKTL